MKKIYLSYAICYLLFASISFARYLTPTIIGGIVGNMLSQASRRQAPTPPKLTPVDSSRPLAQPEEIPSGIKFDPDKCDPNAKYYRKYKKKMHRCTDDNGNGFLIPDSDYRRLMKRALAHPDLNWYYDGKVFNMEKKPNPSEFDNFLSRLEKDLIRISEDALKKVFWVGIAPLPSPDVQDRDRLTDINAFNTANFDNEQTVLIMRHMGFINSRPNLDNEEIKAKLGLIRDAVKLIWARSNGGKIVITGKNDDRNYYVIKKDIRLLQDYEDLLNEYINGTKPLKTDFSKKVDEGE